MALCCETAPPDSLVAFRKDEVFVFVYLFVFVL